MNVFTLNGDVVSTTALATMDVVVPVHRGGVGMLSPGFRQRDGGFISDFTTIAPNGDFEVRALRGRGLVNRVAPTDTVMVPIVRFHASGSRVDTIGALPLPPPDDTPSPPPARGAGGRGRSGTVQVGAVTYSVPTVPWTRYLSVARADGSVIVTRVPAANDRPATFDFTRFDLAGKVAQQIRFTYKPRRYDSRVLDSLAMREIARRGDENAEAFRAVRAQMSFPAFQAPVYTVWPASDGAMWIRREWDASANHRWIVVDRRSGVRGIVLLPSGARPVWADANIVVTEEPDETGVPWLVRYRVARGP